MKSTKTSKTFIDTNIFVYRSDPRDPKKQGAAQRVVERLSDSGVISTQVMQEFYHVATRKFRLDPLLVKDVVADFRIQFEIVVITPNLIQEAIGCSILERISFWDSLLIVAAEAARCSELLTEDLNHGQTIRGMKIVNPFLPS